jgi:hypothetical protein
MSSPDFKNPQFYKTPDNMSDREYSIVLDEALGFEIVSVEDTLSSQYRTYNEHHKDDKAKKHYEGTQAWIGLHPQILQTPYAEILDFLTLLEKFKINKLVDLGAGYGRVGIVQAAVFPDSEFIGYEIVEDRVKEGQRVFEQLGLVNHQLLSKNILDSDFELPKADVYFIYDFSDPGDLKYILNMLSDIIFKEEFFIVAKGAGVRSMISNKYPQFWSNHGVIHAKEWSLYSSFKDLN